MEFLEKMEACELDIQKVTSALSVLADALQHGANEHTGDAANMCYLLGDTLERTGEQLSDAIRSAYAEHK